MFSRKKYDSGYGSNYGYGYGYGYSSGYGYDDYNKYYSGNYAYKSNLKVHEAIKILRTNIQFSAIDKPVRTIVVTSSIPGEGKSTISHFLAIEMAKAGNKTLIVECDLRRPTQNRMFNTKTDRGLTKYLAGECTLEEAAIPTSTENLFFLDVDARVINPVELLGSDRFIKAMDEMKEKFDIVIFDTLPMNQFIEGALVAAHADGTVIVVRAKQVDQRSVEQTIAQLRKANANILGVALNDVKSSRRGYYNLYRKYNSYYGYNNYYGNYGYGKNDNSYDNNGNDSNLLNK